MGYVEQYAAIVGELIKLRGDAGIDSTGNRVPLMTGDDTVGVLGLYTRGLIAAISRRGIIVASAFATADGKITSGLSADASASDVASAYLIAKSHTRTPAQYLAARASSPSWRRLCPADSAEIAAARAAGYGYVVTFEPVRDLQGIRDDQLEQIYFLRESIDEYERALYASSSAFALYGAGKISKDAAATFLLAIRQLGRSLDVMSENPPTTFVQDLRGALKASAGATAVALEEGAKTAGEWAANVADTAGRVAGGFTGGFLANAGLLTLVIAGVVVYKVIP